MKYVKLRSCCDVVEESPKDAFKQSIFNFLDSLSYGSITPTQFEASVTDLVQKHDPNSKLGLYSEVNPIVKSFQNELRGKIENLTKMLNLVSSTRFSSL